MRTLENYKLESIKPKKSDIGWKILFDELKNQFIKWELIGTLDDIDMSDYVYPIGKQFEPDFFKEYIRKALGIPRTKIYEDIIDIVKTKSEPLSYHGSAGDKLTETWELKIKSKREIISSLPSSWIFENFNEVKKFMEEDDFYNELVLLKPFFPVLTEV